MTGSEVLNPVDVENEILAIRDRIAKGVRVVSDRYEALKTATREYDVAFARAFMAHESNAYEKKYAATVATIGERQRMDAADVLYKYAVRQAEALDKDLSAMQSVGASVRAMYGTPQGVGR